MPQVNLGQPQKDKLRLPQVRVLEALRHIRGAIPLKTLSSKAGFTSLSGTLTRALHGLKEGSSSGAAHPGLLELGLIESEEVDWDGMKEVVYRLTDKGREWLPDEAKAALPTKRDEVASTNKRYRKPTDEKDGEQ